MIPATIVTVLLIVGLVWFFFFGPKVGPTNKVFVKPSRSLPGWYQRKRRTWVKAFSTH